MKTFQMGGVMDDGLKEYLNRKKFIKCEEVNYADLKTRRTVYINPEKIITVEPANRNGIDFSWVLIDGIKDELFIKGEAEEFLWACKINTVDFDD